MSLKFRYESDRLILQVLSSKQAPDVLHFYMENAAAFEPVEPVRPADFYSVDFQNRLLEAEQQCFMRLDGARYYMFLKDDPSEIVGCIHFYEIKQISNRQSCTVGYKVATKYQHQGYCSEALSYLMQVLSEDIGISRFEAHIMPSNQASIALAENTGFELEGLLRKNLKINGTWQDHYLYSYLLR